MRPRECRSFAFFYPLVFLASQTGIVAIMEVTLDSPLSGFILKPEKDSLSNLFSQEKEYFIAPVMQTSLLTSVRAEFGDYVSEQRVSQSSIKKALGASQIPTNALVGDHEISAHVVRQSISPDRPLVQVLFHASIIPPASHRSEKSGENWSGSDFSSNFRNDSKYCLISYILKEMLSLSSVCALNERTKVCLTEIQIPSEWWAVDEAVNVNVFYSAAVSDHNVNCTEAFNQTDRVFDSDKNFVSIVTLANSPLTYEELKEDSNILVYIPQASFYPGSTFRMPVKLHSDSNLETFIMKVKARHGVRVIGAEPRNSSVWKITLDLNHKLHGAMVTASAVSKSPYNRAVTDIFEWIFEVDEDAYGDDRGRINILLEYEKMTSQKDFSQPVENRLVARVEIQRDNIFSIVPVVKMRELVNLAVLTGKMQNYNIRIYSVTHSGRIADVTSQSTCHSSDDTIIKVVESCNWIYLDGTEIRSSSSASIIAKFGRHTKFLVFKVWMPEFPLDVELSDKELGLIKGWKVTPESHRLSRTARGTDYGSLTNSGQGQQDKVTGRKDVSMVIACDVRYQLSVLEVYASFVSTSGLNKQYLMKHEAKFRLTDLLLSQIRVTDPTVITLKGNVVEGLKPGLSEIQVVSSSGKVVGTKEIVVSNDKVSIEKLQVYLVVGLSLVVDADLDVPGTLLARISRHDQLKRKDKDALLDISLKFDDGTVVPLQYFLSKDYILDLEVVDDEVIGLGAAFSPAMPRVIAHGQGKGKVLKVSLELADVCQRKASRPLGVGYAYADIDFMKPLTELERLQNDAEQYKFGGNKQGTVRGNTGVTQAPHNIKQTAHVSYDGSVNAENELGDRIENSAATDRGSIQKTSQQKEVQQKHISYGQKLTSLEVGMYVLLGVFCVAVIIFGINCTIFVIRYRRKKSPSGDYKDTVNCAPDWVWISRDMLERNDINTSCSQALMPEADFNVNNHSPSGAASSSATVSERNTCTSNRNSFVSTYRGSECSVQVAVASAISECSAGALNDRLGRHTGSLTQINAYQGTPSRPTPQQIRQYMEEMEISKELHKGRKKSSAINREERLRHIEEGAASGSDFEWDYEVLGVTYEELMEYFDNLKESTA